MTSQERFDRRFFQVVSYLLNIILGGYVITMYGLYGGALAPAPPSAPLPLENVPAVAECAQAPAGASAAILGALLGALEVWPGCS